MLTITPSGDILGATVDGLDLAQPMANQTFAELLAALGENGYLRFPGQTLESIELKAFSERFGDIQAGVAKPSKHVDCPGVGILSNIKVDGEYIGFPAWRAIVVIHRTQVAISHSPLHFLLACTPVVHPASADHFSESFDFSIVKKALSVSEAVDHESFTVWSSGTACA